MSREQLPWQIIILLTLGLSISGCVTNQTGYTYGLIQVNGTVASANLSSYNLSLCSEAGPCLPLLSGINLTNRTGQYNESIIATIETSAYPDGKYILNLTAYDLSNQSSTDLMYFAIDNLYITAPSNHSVYIGNSTLNITGTATGAYSDRLLISYGSNGTGEQLTAALSSSAATHPHFENTTISVLNLSQLSGVGLYMLNLTMNNSGGFTNSENLIFTVTLPDGYEPDGNWSLARWITTDNISQAHTYHDYWDLDWQKFNATENYVYYIFATHTLDTYPVVFLLNSSIITINYSYMNLPGLDTGLTWLSRANATHYIASYCYDAFGLNYTISVSAIGPFNDTVFIPSSYVTDISDDGNADIIWEYAHANRSLSYSVFRSDSMINLSTLGSASMIRRVRDHTVGLEEQFSITDNATAHNTTYWYAVMVVDEYGRNSSNISLSHNVTVNDSIIPKVPGHINVTNASNAASITWTPVIYDVEGHPDFTGLTYRLWYGTAIDLNATYANDTLAFLKEVSFAAGNSTTWSIPSTCVSPCRYYFAVTTVDDAGNRNLTLTAGNLANVTLSYTAPAAQAITSSDSGGGGGGGVIGVPKQDQFSKILFRVDQKLSVAIDRSLIPVESIECTVSQPVTNVEVSLASIPKPVQLPDVSTEPYSYLSITVGKMDGAVADARTIKFKVANAWLSEKIVGKDDISLYRFVAGEWQELSTEYLREDGTNAYYRAATPGFSYFAIAGKGGMKRPVIQGEAITELPEETRPNETAPETAVQVAAPQTLVPAVEKPSRSFGVFYWVIGAACAIALASAVLHYGRQALQDRSVRQKIKEYGKEPPPDAELMNYVKASLRQGAREEEIWEALLKVGWPEEQIERALNHLGKRK